MRTAPDLHEEDLQLAAAIVARDRKASARFVALHTDAVYRFIWRRLTPRTDSVEDLVQEVFLASWRSLSSYAGQAPLEAWLLSIAKHKVEDYYRRTLSAALSTEDLTDEPGDHNLPAELESSLDSQRLAHRAAAVLNGLRYEHSLLLRWRYWDGRSAREMAAATGRTEKSIERLLARARAQFRQRWTAGEGRQA